MRAATAPITIAVDASDAPRKIFHVRETIPASPGKLTLVYPKYIPGEHGPTGPITDLVGLKITAAGKPVPWQRQPKEMWSFDVTVPDGASSLDVAFDYVATPEGWTTATAQLAVVNWWTVMLYPEVPGANELSFAPSLKVPAGWEHATSLRPGRGSADGISFAPVSLVILIDSPVLMGAHLKTVDLTPGQQPGHWLHIAGDSAASIQISEADVAVYRRLVAEAFALFGARHYEQYHFLLTLSDHVSVNGLEHHESSDNRAAERSLIDPDAKKILGTLLSHEYVHSWNGKYRRPEGLVSGVSADYQPPVDSRLLWVYEGMTEYWGDVLGGRSGMRSPELYRENLAVIAGNMARQAGRAWRPLEDTATAAQLLYFGRPEWASWRRGVDFYPESELVWLEADAIIRQKTGGKKSLDDFSPRVPRRSGRRARGEDLHVRRRRRGAAGRGAERLGRFLPRAHRRRRAGSAVSRHRGVGLARRVRRGEAGPRAGGGGGVGYLRLLAIARDRREGRRHVRRRRRRDHPGRRAGNAGGGGGRRSGDAARRGQRTPLLRQGPARGASGGEGRVDAHRAARRERGHLQDVPRRLPRRGEVPAPGAGCIEARPAQRDRESKGDSRFRNR